MSAATDKRIAELEERAERAEQRAAEFLEDLYPGKPMHATEQEAGIYFAHSLARMKDTTISREEFFGQLLDRLASGEREQGDASFELSPLELLKELRAEALDMAGWGFVLWKRLQGLVDVIRLSDPETSRAMLEGTGGDLVGDSDRLVGDDLEQGGQS